MIIRSRILLLRELIGHGRKKNYSLESPVEGSKVRSFETTRAVSVARR